MQPKIARLAVAGLAIIAVAACAKKNDSSSQPQSAKVVTNEVSSKATLAAAPATEGAVTFAGVTKEDGSAISDSDVSRATTEFPALGSGLALISSATRASIATDGTITLFDASGILAVIHADGSVENVRGGAALPITAVGVRNQAATPASVDPQAQGQAQGQSQAQTACTATQIFLTMRDTANKEVAVPASVGQSQAQGQAQGQSQAQSQQQVAKKEIRHAALTATLTVACEQPKQQQAQTQAKEEPKVMPKEQPKQVEAQPKEMPKEQPKQVLEQPKEMPKEQPKEIPKEQPKQQAQAQSKGGGSTL